MCGLAGIFGNVDEPRLNAMAQSLRHRGPDDDGMWLHHHVPIGFAHRRLSIIDVATGHQPMADEDASVVVVFNGAIYNHVELRESLQQRGLRFATKSDTETIVQGYREHGDAWFAELRGMFAIALWDEVRRALILARDPLGKKPLYFAEHRDEFLFASEIKGVIAGMKRTPNLSERGLDAFLTWGCVPGPGTIYREVSSVEPGEIIVVRDGRVERRRKYWRPRFEPVDTVSRADAVERTDALLREAVRIRLRSDVDVGCFLSGGIDSGLIVAMASAMYAGTLKTITVGFDDERFDERPLAEEVASRYRTEHHEVRIRPDLTGDLASIVRAYDQPYADSSAIPSYYAAKAAREHVKVVLNGDGGDELFAGYRRHVAAMISDRLIGRDSPGVQSLWAGLASILPPTHGFRTPRAFARRFARGMGMDRLNRYLTWALDGVDATMRATRLSRPGRRGGLLDAFDPRRYFASLGIRFDPGTPFLTQMLEADLVSVLPYDLLVKVDIACMAHGLEARSPLLDVRLADAVTRYPERIKLSSSVTKPILRDLARRYLPRQVCDGPKRGFEVPLVRWLRGPLRPAAEDVILSSSGLIGDLFDRKPLELLLRSPESLEPGRWARYVWILFMLGMWDQCVRGRPADHRE